MKKIVVMLAVILLLAGCGGDIITDSKEPIDPAESPIADQTEPSQTETAEPEETTFPGTYTVPDGWIKSNKYSTSEMIFYIEEGHENDEYPDNISINVETNRYSLIARYQLPVMEGRVHHKTACHKGCRMLLFLS